MIKLENITYRYRGGSRAALRNLNLHVDRGEAVCVMGRNGSGKSTLARLVAGLIKPEQGRVVVNGDDTRPIDGGPRVGILFQNTDNQMVATLVDSELAFALENMAFGQDEMEAAVTAVAERFGISHLLRRLTSDLSGGEKQRVALASIMIQDPPVLVLDEPDSFLDEAGRRILSSELLRIHRHASPKTLRWRAIIRDLWLSTTAKCAPTARLRSCCRTRH
jgi:energy-coupling factor transporter ATP-binding protein EcfA2